jgi:hypothetical protein
VLKFDIDWDIKAVTNKKFFYINFREQKIFKYHDHRKSMDWKFSKKRRNFLFFSTASKLRAIAQAAAA